MIEISSRRFKQAVLLEMVHAASSSGVEVHTQSNQVRQFDATVLVSLVAAAGGTLTALVTGLMSYAKNRGGQKIVIVVDDRRVEVPVGTAPELVREYVSAVEKQPSLKILVE